MIWWTFKDFPSSNPEPSKWWKYGIVTEDLHIKPVFSAYQTITRELTGSAFERELNIPNVEGYLFTNGLQSTAVLWASSDKAVNVTFAGTRISVTDKVGATQVVVDGSADDLDQNAGTIGIQVGPSPIYVQLIQ
jgi:hypothetical protein